MNKIFILLFILLASFSSNAVVKNKIVATTKQSIILEETSKLYQHQFNELKKNISKKVKHFFARHNNIPQALYIILSVFGLSWLAIGINDNWNGYDWLNALLLTLAGIFVFGILGLFFFPFFIFMLIPGIIYAFIKRKEYYN